MFRFINNSYKIKTKLHEYDMNISIFFWMAYIPFWLNFGVKNAVSNCR